nr:hypothetical protein [uncultured archaeon]
MKKETWLLLLIIIATVSLFSFSRLFNESSPIDAKKFFMEDLESSYPHADVREIISIETAGDGRGTYYVLKARVSSNLSTPCPERVEVEYYYPTKNFLKSDEQVVHGCNVCLDNPNCHISYPEEAIIASHTYEGTDEVTAFLRAYPQATPSPSLLKKYDGQRDAWQVDWKAKDGPTMRVILSSFGTSALSVEMLE